MSGRYSRNKGRRGEQEVVLLIKQYGHQAKRISMLESGGVDWGDVNWEGEGICSVKCGSHVPKFLYDAMGDARFLFFRRDRGKWMVVVAAEDLLTHWKTKS